MTSCAMLLNYLLELMLIVTLHAQFCAELQTLHE